MTEMISTAAVPSVRDCRCSPAESQGKPKGRAAERASEDGRPADAVAISFSQTALEHVQSSTVAGRGLADRLRDSAANDAGDGMSDALEEALKSIRWLLKALGLDLSDAEKAKQLLRDKIADRLDGRRQAGPAVEIVHETRLTLDVRNLEISVRQGDAEVSVSFSSVSLSYSSETRVTRREDPLVLDLSGDGITLTAPEAGERFDIDGDGVAEQTAWVRGDDALLAMDRDGDGRITSGRELFGQANGGADGFDELSRLDANGDGAIDAADPGYSALLLLRGGGRLDRLDEAGIARIHLDARVPINLPAGGGVLVAASAFERTGGGAGLIADALVDVTT